MSILASTVDGIAYRTRRGFESSASSRLETTEKRERDELSVAAELLDPLDEWLPPYLRTKGWPKETIASLQRHRKEEENRGRFESWGESALRLGLLTPTAWGEALAGRINWSVLTKSDLSQIDHSLCRRWPTEKLKRLGFVPLRREAETLFLACVDPRVVHRNREGLGLSLIFAGEALPRTLKWQLIPANELAAWFERDDFTSAVTVVSLNGEKLVQALLREAVKEEASDIHFVPREQVLEVKFRIDGRLWTKHLFPTDRMEEILANAKMAGGLDIGRLGEPLDGGGRIQVGSRSFKLRFSSMPSQYGQQVVIRLLDQDATAIPLPELGMSLRDLELLQGVLSGPQGLIYLVGPTGCGKSTTLASLLSTLDGASYAIRTLENPIEYRLTNAVQSEVGSDLTFASGLRALLRQDPDYLLVGETRDLETAEISIEAGLTGHMCFSTLHANDAVGGIVRLLDLGVQAGPLLAACELFVAQRLVRRLCQRCARPSENSKTMIERHQLEPQANEQLWEPVGCPYCRDGYKGRVAVFEVRHVGDFAELVQKHGASCAPHCRELSRKNGLSRMRDDGLRKALRGLTTIEEVLSLTPV